MAHNINIQGQITPEQVATLGEQGFKTIINNRPDGEESNQPLSADIAAAAEQAGIAYKEISFAGTGLTQQHVEDFADFFNQAEQPVLIFCRTGARSTGIYEAAKKMDLLDD
ncbi:TIGR01244 family sulfur transferase [Psychrobacter sp. M13]|uniref:TIGR01244 family sulfur transferase n=1 Tax=Psychrobacter sp. M13 TaxID=3067275 RepID=UPI0019186281|nr:TIGR01244 family sulfur transferase [Psychrobacter sp. M13]WLP94081.1 TIGR01244 family sulfur transferase [Psychrobacter sp. M13]